MRSHPLPVVVLIAALLGTAACGGGSDEIRAVAADRPAASTPATAAPDGTASPSGAAPARPAEVPESLRFTGKTLDGKPFAGADLAGRPVVLWFWAPWCATCASQAWTVAEVAPKYRDTVPVVGVAGLGEQKAMRDFVTEFDLGAVPQLDDRGGEIWRRFEIVEQSTFLIIDRNGRVVHQGFLDGEDLSRRLAALAR